MVYLDDSACVLSDLTWLPLMVYIRFGTLSKWLLLENILLNPLMVNPLANNDILFQFEFTQFHILLLPSLHITCYYCNEISQAF